MNCLFITTAFNIFTTDFHFFTTPPSILTTPPSILTTLLCSLRSEIYLSLNHNCWHTLCPCDLHGSSVTELLQERAQ
jgi:hypothetical protein